MFARKRAWVRAWLRYISAVQPSFDTEQKLEGYVRRVSNTREFLVREDVSIRAKEMPEDFQVDEVPLYAPSGQGDHVYLHIRKRELSTHDAVAAIAAHVGKSSKDFGIPGLKDKYAVTTQWISIEHVPPGLVETFAHPQIEILTHTKHNNKLRTGHLLANRFQLRLRGIPEGHRDEVLRLLEADLDTLMQDGLPNYYGMQRFGRNNIAEAEAWIAGGMRRVRDPKFMVSVLQAYWFNDALAQRVSDRSYASVWHGELARKEDTGGMFVVEDPVVDKERAREFLISATGPMFGAEMRAPLHDALRFEDGLQQKFNITPEVLAGFRRFGAGTRRPYRVRMEDASVGYEDHALLLSFVLPSGSYATTLLDELLPWKDVGASRKKPSHNETEADASAEPGNTP